MSNSRTFFELTEKCIREIYTDSENEIFVQWKNSISQIANALGLTFDFSLYTAEECYFDDHGLVFCFENYTDCYADGTPYYETETIPMEVITSDNPLKAAKVYKLQEEIRYINKSIDLSKSRKQYAYSTISKIDAEIEKDQTRICDILEKIKKIS